jgi:hypothetical protein
VGAFPDDQPHEAKTFEPPGAAEVCLSSYLPESVPQLRSYQVSRLLRTILDEARETHKPPATYSVTAFPSTRYRDHHHQTPADQSP